MGLVGVPFPGMARGDCEACAVSLDTGRRPTRRGHDVAPVKRQPALPLVVAGALGGVGAAALSLGVLSCITLTAWMLDPGADLSWSSMLEAATGAYLLGQGVPLVVDSVTVSLPPLGFALLSIALLAFGARWAARASDVGRRGEAIAVAASAAVGYAAVSALAAELARALGASALTAFLACGGIAFAVCAFVILRSAGLMAAESVPPRLRDACAGGVAGALLLLGAGALVVLASVLVHTADVGLVLGELRLGLSGALLVTVLSLGYLPVVIIWGTSYLLGPGFAISAGSTIGPLADASSTTLPGFPLLAAVPADAPPFAIALPAVAVGAGAVVGLLLRRRGHHGMRGIGLAAASALMTGVLIGFAGWLATGSLGVVRLVSVGPSPLLVGAAAFVTVAVGAAMVVPWPTRHADTVDD